MGIIENNKARKLPNKCRSRNKKKNFRGKWIIKFESLKVSVSCVRGERLIVC